MVYISEYEAEGEEEPSRFQVLTSSVKYLFSKHSLSNFVAVFSGYSSLGLRWCGNSMWILATSGLVLFFPVRRLLEVDDDFIARESVRSILQASREEQLRS